MSACSLGNCDIRNSNSLLCVYSVFPCWMTGLNPVLFALLGFEVKRDLWPEPTMKF